MSFYEIKINCTNQGFDLEKYRDLVLEKVLPLIEKLEVLNLISGFHFICHGTLDLRLAIIDEDYLGLVNQEISASGLSGYNLEECPSSDENPSEEYERFGPEGNEILHKALEFNSRLIMMIFKYRKDRPQNNINQLIEALNHQIVHYFLVQQAINNTQQVEFSLNDAKDWAKSILHGTQQNLSPKEKGILNNIVDFNPFSKINS